ncbi:unnamed protein product [Arctia plantaginis]|uniref:Uncharacterized protein n=1 Tax=Arctia plantaginis TaxID=874455 RepID=A0A8S0YYV3_ARCPL|nr:unnamed protein product [Arctia plantaginis]
MSIDTWSWLKQLDPVEYYFKIENLPIKKPTLECRCPPSKECAIEYKKNYDIAEFLAIQGLLKNDVSRKTMGNFRRSRENDIRPYQDYNEKSSVLRMRRQALQATGNGNVDCCCPPRNIMMPTFITDKKFETLLANKLRNKYTEDLQYNLNK